MAWITAAQVAARLGPTAPPDDSVIADVTDAADAYCQRRRAKWYVDDPDVSPGPDVTDACIQYAMASYRLRAAVDGMPSYSEFDTPPPTMASVERRVDKLLRVPRPVIA